MALYVTTASAPDPAAGPAPGRTQGQTVSQTIGGTALKAASETADGTTFPVLPGAAFDTNVQAAWGTGWGTLPTSLYHPAG